MRELRGVTASEAARQLQIAAGGVPEEPRPHLVGACADEALILDALRGRDVDARIVKLAGGDLRWLRTPAALQLDDGIWLVLRRLPRTGRRALAARTTGLAIEVTPPFDLAHPFRFAAAHAAPLAMMAAAALVLQLLAAAVPWLTRAAIDTALPHGAASMLSAIALALALTASFAAATAWLRGIALVALKATFDIASGRALLQHFLRLPFADVQRRGAGRSMQAMTGMQLARDLVLERVARAALDLLGVLAYGVAIFILFPAGALIAGAASLAIVAVSLLTGARQARLQGEELTHQARQQTLLFEAIAGIGTVKAAGAEERTAQRWSAIFTAETLAALRRMRAALGADIAGDVARSIAIAALLVWGSAAAMRGALTLGSVIALLQLASAVLAAVSGAASAIVALRITQQHLAPTLEVVHTPAEPPRRPRRGRSASRVVLDDVWFRHDAHGPWVIQACSLTVEPGTIHHLDGPSGSGKSTLLRLIAGLYEPERGIVRTGGSAFGYLPQFPHLFGGTIADNLRIFSGGASMRELLDSAAETGLHDWVRSLPMQYETRIAAGGLSFSGGQRQLITLTAVLASDRPLLLLDEPMANLDGTSRARIRQLLARAGRTVIHASHDNFTDTAAV